MRQVSGMKVNALPIFVVNNLFPLNTRFLTLCSSIRQIFGSFLHSVNAISLQVNFSHRSTTVQYFSRSFQIPSSRLLSTVKSGERWHSMYRGEQGWGHILTQPHLTRHSTYVRQRRIASFSKTISRKSGELPPLSQPFLRYGKLHSRPTILQVPLALETY